MRKRVLKYWENEDKRTTLIYKNILGSFFIKGWTGIVQILLVPATLSCLNQYEYGVWLTISSLLLWVDTFDIGLGNGLRNNLAISIAHKDSKRARRQVSTTLFMLIFTIFIMLSIIFIIIKNVNCFHLLNVNRDIIPNLEGILLASVSIMSATFVLKIIGNIYLALQLPAINNLLIALGHTIALASIWILSYFQGITLLHVAISYTLSPLLVYIISYPITFAKYKYLRPSWRFFDKKEVGSLFYLGISFFFAQFSGLIIFASSNILISHLFSPNDVTPYQIAFRYFGIINILFSIISSPYWSATTDAYTKDDWLWIRKSVHKLNVVIITFIVILALMVFVSKYIYKIWVGGNILIPFELSLLMAVYVLVLIYGTCYSNMICGIGKIRLLTIITIVEAIIYIPLAIFFAKMSGITGIVIALICVNLISAVSNKVQFSLICTKKAKGIWNK